MASSWLTHTAERNSLLNPKRFRELLKAAPFWAIAHHGKASRIVSQKGSRGAQREIASFQRNQPSNENQLKFGAGFRTALSLEHKERLITGFRDKEKLVAIRGKLGVRLG